MGRLKIKSPLSFALAFLLVASFITSTFTATKAYALTPLSAAPRVSFTFDDGLTSSLTNAAPVLAAHGLTGTNYVITDCVGMTTTPNACAADGDASYMSWEQIAQLNSMGWEIASHTANHPQLSTDGLTNTQLTAQLVNSQNALKAHGYAGTNLAFPYGDYDNNVLAQTAKYYESARGFADLGYNTWPYNNSLIVNQQVQAGVSVATVKGYIDQAIANNQWLVLTFHEIRPTASNDPQDYQYSNADLDAIAAYVQAKQAANQIKSVNITDGLVRGTNMLPNGTFNNGIADGWTTDDAINITADTGNNGRFPDPTNSISLKSGATPTGDTHLFSPQVAVTPGNQYIIKNYVNILSGGEIDFFIDEYDAAGTYLSGQYHQGVVYGSAQGITTVKDVNFGYVPTSASVAKARLQVIVHGANVNAYYDGAQWLSFEDVATPPVDPVLVPGDVNGDNVINALDLSTLLRNWNLTNQTRAQGDVNNDGTVNALDLSTVLNNWSK